MARRQSGVTHRVSLPDCSLSIADGLPPLYTEYCARAKLVDEFDLDAAGSDVFVLAAATDDKTWPDLVTAQTYSPGSSGGFHPGCLLVPETGRLFIGAGTRLLCYDLAETVRLWQDEVDCGFWQWSRSGGFVLMSAELEFAVWNLTGKKLWSRFVEPPWDFLTTEGRVTLDVMGDVTTLRLVDGKPV